MDQSNAEMIISEICHRVYARVCVCGADNITIYRLVDN